MTSGEARLRFTERQAAKDAHAALLARDCRLPVRQTMMRPGRRTIPVKRPMEVLPPAVVATCRAELARAMFLASGGKPGRPRREGGGRPDGPRGSRRGTAPKSAAHREALAASMRARWAAKRAGG